MKMYHLIFDGHSAYTRRGGYYVPIPTKFIRLLKSLSKKRDVDFTYLNDGIFHVMSIARYPKEKFNRKDGQRDVMGRLAKLKEYWNENDARLETYLLHEYVFIGEEDAVCDIYTGQRIILN